MDTDEVREVVRDLSDLFRKHVTHDKASFRSTVLYKTFRTLDARFEHDYKINAISAPNQLNAQHGKRQRQVVNG